MPSHTSAQPSPTPSLPHALAALSPLALASTLLSFLPPRLFTSTPAQLAAALLSLALPACVAVDPGTLELEPALELRCHHPDAWFEGIYAAPPSAHAAPSSAHPGAPVLAYPAATPHRPAPLATRLPATAWDGPTGPAAQTACADACVGLAEPGFLYRCPDAGWQVAAEPTLAPPPATLPELLAPDACYPDSACAAAFAAPIGLALRGPASLAGPADHLARADAELLLQLPGAHVRHPVHATASYSAGACEAAPCSLYLASLTLSDDGARSRAHLALVDLAVPAVLEALELELLRPALATLDPATGDLEFPAGALELRVQLAISAGGQIDPGPRELLLRNPLPIPGRLVDGALRLTTEFPLASLGSARLELEFQPTAHPPVAELTLPARLAAGPLPSDPHAPSRLHAAHDPDGDLAALIWVVDGLPGARQLPPGEHELALWVADRRGALARSATRLVQVHE